MHGDIDGREGGGGCAGGAGIPPAIQSTGNGIASLMNSSMNSSINRISDSVGSFFKSVGNTISAWGSIQGSGFVPSSCPHCPRSTAGPGEPGTAYQGYQVGVILYSFQIQTRVFLSFFSPFPALKF